MFGKNKYDIMENELIKEGIKEITIDILKGIKYQYLKLKENIQILNGNNEITIESIKCLYGNSQSSIYFWHLCYENLKDLETIDKQKLLKYIKRNGLTVKEFACQCFETKTLCERILMMATLFDRDNVSFTDFIHESMLIQLKQNGKLEIDFSEYDKLSKETIGVLSDMLIHNIKLSDLGEENIKLFEDYHDRYMMQQIYLKVTKSGITEKEIIKMAKTFVLSKMYIKS